MLSADYIPTVIAIKPSTVLYYLFDVSTTAIGSSSKKRLLLHDGWLEMWAIILLLSSDVERNPGPRQITGKFTFMYGYNTILHMHVIICILLQYSDAQLSKVDNRVLGM